MELNTYRLNSLEEPTDDGSLYKQYVEEFPEWAQSLLQ